jgi:uncharacterized damage-inducible protein DinB
MKDFLIEMFEFNKDANVKMASKIGSLVSPEEGIRLLSHLVNCQYKWLDRINVFPSDSGLDWWLPIYSTDELPQQFVESTQNWTDYLAGKTEEELEEIKKYIGWDGNVWESKLKDIALQLIFHSFHHRAQMQMLIRAQDQKPGFIDYIGYKAKKSETN